MAGQLHVLRRRIRSVKSTKKITKAQELVATSRIAKAQERVAASRPYAEAITHVLTALASNANIDHPLLVPRPQTSSTPQVIGGRPIDGVALLEWARTVIDTILDPDRAPSPSAAP